MLKGVSHAQITIPKGAEPEAKHFYLSVLGLKEIDKPEVLKPNGGFWMQLQNIQIHVGTEDGVERNRAYSL